MKTLIFLFLLLSIYSEPNPYMAMLEYDFSDTINTIDKSTFSVDSKILASGDWEGNIYLYSLQGLLLGSLKEHQQRITGLKFLPDNLLLSSSMDTTVRLWDTTNKTQLHVFTSNYPIIGIDTSTNGKWLVTIDQNSFLKIISIETKSLLKTVKIPKGIKKVCCRNNNIYITTINKEVIILDFTGNIITQLSTGQDIDFIDAKNDFMVTAGERHFKVWNTKQQKFIIQKSFSRTIQGICFVNDSDKLLVYSGGVIYVCILSEKTQFQILSEVYFYDIVISSNGKYLCGMGDKKIQVYELLQISNGENISFYSNDTTQYLKSKLEKEEILPSLLPGILILPIVDENNLTSELGTFLSLKATFCATYAPQKILNIPFAELEKSFLENQLFVSQQNILQETVERIKNQFAFLHIARVKMKTTAEGYDIIVHCEGSFSAKKYHNFFSFAQVGNIPLWLAEKVHEYLGVILSPSSKSFLSTQSSSAESALKASEIYSLYHTSKFTVAIEPWYILLQNNPQCIFFYAQYSYSYFGNYSKPIEELMKILEEHPTHFYLRLRAADFYLATHQNKKAIKMYLQLLFQDSKNFFLYKILMQALQQEKEWELIKVVLLFASHHLSDLYWYNVLGGEYYIDYAWEVLPSVNGKQKFLDNMEKAKKFLTMAYNANHNRWQAPSLMIKVCMGLQKKRQEMESWFKKAIEHHPYCTEAHWQKFNYLTPRWYGNKKEMLSFVREINNTVPDSSALRFLVLNAHRELLPDNDYYKNKEIWADIQKVFEPYLKIYPKDIAKRIWYWEYATLAQQYQIAALEYLTFEENGQLEPLLQSIHYQKQDKTPMYFAIADIFIQRQKQEQSLVWLEKALHYKPDDWDYQQKYIDILMQKQNYERAYEHLLPMAKSSEKYRTYAEAKLNLLQSKIKKTNIILESDKTIYILASTDLPKEFINSAAEKIKKNYGITPVVLPETYSYNKHFLIAEKSFKIQQTLATLYKTMGKNEVEAYRGLHELGKTIKDDVLLLYKILSTTPQGSKVLKDIDKNYYNRWDTTSMLHELQTRYKGLLEETKSAGLLLLVNEEIGNLERGYKLTDGTKKVAIVSLHRLQDKSPQKISLRIEKLLHYCISKIFSAKDCTVPNCPCSFNADISSLDKKNENICEESLKDIWRNFNK